ncbi:MAG TPA: alpha/beta hydrolase [Methanoregula sp.]|nr:alpha/beta hydrolase [Methanoregula sp.]
MNFPLLDEIALISGEQSFLLVAKANERFPLCIENPEGEICQGVDPTDLVVVSAPGGGPVEPGIMLIELVRKHHLPLLVLPKDHPGSGRLGWVISVGPRIETNCAIRRGTHPEQQVICSHDELSGLTLTGTREGFATTPLPGGVFVKMLKSRLETEFC